MPEGLNILREVPAGATFGDLRVGMVSRITIPESGGLDGLPLIFGLIEEARPCRWGSLSYVQWEASSCPPADTCTEMEATVTRWYLDREPGSGWVHQDLRVRRRTGRWSQQAWAKWRISEIGDVGSDDEARVAMDFGSLAWARSLAARLGQIGDFRDSAATFDGSIGFTSGDEAVEFRMYKGSIIDVTKKTSEGATFWITGREKAWVDLLLSPRNDFVRRAGSGEIGLRGNGYQYLRVFRTVMMMLDQARLAVREAATSA
jgi:hypothetical protein